MRNSGRSCARTGTRQPSGVTTDKDGNVYLVDGFDRVQKGFGGWAGAGEVGKQLTQHADGQFNGPQKRAG